MSAKFAKTGAQDVRAGAAQEPLRLPVRARPDRRCGGKERASGRGDDQPPAAFVGVIHLHLDKTAARERLEIGGERGAVERQQRGDGADGRRLGTVERCQERELPLGQTDRPQRLVEASCQRPRRSLHMQAKTVVAHVMGESEGRCPFEAV